MCATLGCILAIVLMFVFFSSPCQHLLGMVNKYVPQRGLNKFQGMCVACQGRNKFQGMCVACQGRNKFSGMTNRFGRKKSDFM